MATVSRGVADAVTDPQVNLLESLEAILVAELTDDASWEVLIPLAGRAGQGDLQKPFERARANEEEHVAKVRGWIRAGHQVG